MTNNFPNLQIDSLSAAYTRGDITPRDLMAQLKRRSTQLNAEFNLFIHILDEAELDPYLERLENPAAKTKPLYGIPFVIKDNIDLKGVATTAACPAFAYMPKKSATIVEQLIELGALPVGKANLDQFATGLNGTRSPYGICKNSVLPEYPSGGSSAGSALAVALGVASFSLGAIQPVVGVFLLRITIWLALRPVKDLFQQPVLCPPVARLIAQPFLLLRRQKPAVCWGWLPGTTRVMTLAATTRHGTMQQPLAILNRVFGLVCQK